MRATLWGALAALAACGQPTAAPAVPVAPITTGSGSAAPAVDAATPSQEEQLAAIQKAMNDLSPAVQQCWAAVAAADRFDIEGDVAAQIDIGAPTKATIVKDTTKSAKLGACVTALLDAYPWAPPLRGQTIQLPFAFKAPDGQSVIDRQLVPFAGQGKVSVAVLLDENNTGNGAASMFDIKIADGGSTGLRRADRPELWFMLGPANFSTGVGTPMWAGAADMVYVPAGVVREVTPTGLHGVTFEAVVVVAPGGREGTARAGALPTPAAAADPHAKRKPIVMQLASVTRIPRPTGSVRIFAEPASIQDSVLSASALTLDAGAKVPEHVHANETEMLYMLAGSGTMTVAGTDVAVTPTSVVQIPPNTKHAFVAKELVRALQIYTPAGPEQRFKTKP